MKDLKAYLPGLALVFLCCLAAGEVIHWQDHLGLRDRIEKLEKRPHCDCKRGRTGDIGDVGALAKPMGLELVADDPDTLVRQIDAAGAFIITFDTTKDEDGRELQQMLEGERVKWLATTRESNGWYVVDLAGRPVHRQLIHALLDHPAVCSVVPRWPQPPITRVATETALGPPWFVPQAGQGPRFSCLY